MTGDHGGGAPGAPSGRHPQVESEHVEVGRATIDISQADIVQSPRSRQQARYLAYSLCVLFLFLIATFTISILFTSSQVHHVQRNSEQARQNAVSITAQNAILRKQILADCGFYRDLAGLPLTNLPNGHPSELAVKIISDSRSAWFGHGCPGSLPAPSGTFIAGARFYHIPVVLTGN